MHLYDRHIDCGRKTRGGSRFVNRISHSGATPSAYWLSRVDFAEPDAGVS